MLQGLRLAASVLASQFFSLYVCLVNLCVIKLAQLLIFNRSQSHNYWGWGPLACAFGGVVWVSDSTLAIHPTADTTSGVAVIFSNIFLM